MICLFNLRVMDSASSRSFVGEVSCLPKTKTPDTGIPFLKLTAKAPKIGLLPQEEVNPLPTIHFQWICKFHPIDPKQIP